jgi:hypothetical protein
MKIALVTLLFAASAFALKPPAPLPPACGPQTVFLNVKLDKSQYTLSQPEPGKAQVYFIQDADPQGLGVGSVRRIGLDGAWIGANKNSSWFSVSVNPGEHHVCVQDQPISDRFMDNPVGLMHFTAEAGKVYYYRTRLVLSRTVELLELEPIDSDQGKYLIASFPLSVSTPKK